MERKTCDGLRGMKLEGEFQEEKGTRLVLMVDVKWRHRAADHEERIPKWLNAMLAETRLQIPFESGAKQTQKTSWRG